MIVEGTEYRRINAGRLKPGQYLKIPHKWDAMRELVAHESKAKRRFVVVAGIIGFIVGMAGALMLDRIVQTRNSDAADAIEQASIEPATTAHHAESHDRDRQLFGTAGADRAADEQLGSRLRVSADDVNLRADPTRTKSAIAMLKRGTDLIEINRTSDWVQVEIPSLQGKRGWIHATLVDRANVEAPANNDMSPADETRRLAEAEHELASDGKCRRVPGSDSISINCFQRGDDDGAPDKTLDIFRDLIKLKKFDCDQRIDAASFVNMQERRIFFVQCGQASRYQVEIIGSDLEITPMEMDFDHQALKY